MYRLGGWVFSELASSGTHVDISHGGPYASGPSHSHTHIKSRTRHTRVCLDLAAHRGQTPVRRVSSCVCTTALRYKVEKRREDNPVSRYRVPSIHYRRSVRIQPYTPRDRPGRQRRRVPKRRSSAPGERLLTDGGCHLGSPCPGARRSSS